MSAVASLARLPIARLTRSPRAWLPLLGWSLLALVAALVERARSSPSAADMVVLLPVGGLAIPLIAFGVVAAITGGERFDTAQRGLVAIGAPPRAAARAHVGVALVASALLGAIVAAVAVVVAGSAHGTAGDALTSAWVCALGGAAYAALFCAGATVGRRGGGRVALLFVDWILGAGAGAGAAIVPRGHLRSLLGGTPPLDWAQWKSVVALLVITALGSLLALRSSR